MTLGNDDVQFAQMLENQICNYYDNHGNHYRW
jgi:hypothetical protein